MVGGRSPCVTGRRSSHHAGVWKYGYDDRTARLDWSAAELSQVALNDVVRSPAEQRAGGAGGPPQAGEVAVSCRSGRTLSTGGSSGAHPQPPVSGPP